MTITLDGIALPDDLIWDDEFNTSKVKQSIRKSLTGALIIQEAAQLAGQIITLKGGEDYAWMTKATLELVKAKHDAPNLEMSLIRNGTTYTVMFLREGSDGGLTAKGVYDLADPDDTHIYSVVLKFIEV